MDIEKKINFLSRFDLNKSILKILNSRKVSDMVVMMQQKRLYETGKDSTGESLGSYSPVTVVLKREKEQRVDHITLRDTGEFYRSMTFSATETELIFDADPVKEENNLFDDFGIDILGLTKKNKERLIGIINSELIILLSFRL